MRTLLPLLSTLAFAHGGEDHGAPAAPPAASSTAESVATWSTEFEAVVRVPYAPPGEAIQGTLLLAEYRTSAPVPAAQPTLTFTGAGAPVAAQFGASAAPGVYPFTVSLPAHGSYAGGLQVMTPDRADILGLPALEYAPASAGDEHDDGWGWLWIGGAVIGALALGVAFGALGGFGAGRLTRRGAGLLLVGALASSSDIVRAHGGEDHSAPAAPQAGAAAGGGLAMPLESQFLLGVRTTMARREPLAPTERIIGRTVMRPGGGAMLAAPITGIIEFQSELVPGMEVRRGQALAVIRESLTGPERADVLAGRTGAQTELVRARRELALADRDASRAEQLEGVISDRERLDRKQALEVAREAVRQAEIAAAGIGSSTTTLTAPVTGRLGSIGARPGELVQQGTQLFALSDEGPLWVEALLPEEVAGRLVAGSDAGITTEARPGEVLKARILDPGLVADPTTGMFRVTLEIVESREWLRPGMSVTGWVTVGEPHEALVVPEDAVVDSNGQTLVFVKTAPESFEARPVALGIAGAGLREVTSGLQPNERVVVAGTYSLRSMAGR